MGLDTVELVMAVEEEFGLTIPDVAAVKMNTVGDMHAFLVSELARLAKPGVDESRIFETLRKIISRELGVDPEAVVAGARFVQDLGVD